MFTKGDTNFLATLLRASTAGKYPRTASLRHPPCCFKSAIEAPAEKAAEAPAEEVKEEAPVAEEEPTEEKSEQKKEA